jgi:hypothetical protein
MKKTIKIIGRIILEIRRWRNRDRLPELVGEVMQTPYWGGVELPILVRNTGRAAARHCRYCRRQQFRMDRGEAHTAATTVTWYATDSFDVATGGVEKQLTAYATTDPCPRLVLMDINGTTQDRRFEAVLVCRDRFGTFYRFMLVDGQDPAMDMWRESPLDRMFRRKPPEWTQWVQLPDKVESRQWTARFA